MTTFHSTTHEKAPRRAFALSNDWKLELHEPPPPGVLDTWLDAYRTRQCQDARNRVVQSHLRLVARSARRFANKAVTFDDLMAEGAIALLRALDNFDHTRGVPFTAYATAVIEHTLRGSAVRARDLVKVPGPQRRKLIAQLREQDRQYLQSGERQPLTETTVQAPRSGATPATAGAPVVPRSTGAPEDLEDQHATPDSRAETADQVARLEEAVCKLPDTARRAICMRFGLFGEAERSPAEMASELRITHRQLEQVLSRASRTLRYMMTDPQEQLRAA